MKNIDNYKGGQHLAISIHQLLEVIICRSNLKKQDK